MATVFSRIRRRLDALPLWAVIGLAGGALGLWMLDFRVPDPITFDRVFLGLVFGGTAYYVWRRYFGPPGALSAAARRKVAEIEILFDEAKRAGTISGSKAEVEQLSSLLDRVKAIEGRLEQTEIVLLSPQYDSYTAAGEVSRLSKLVESSTGQTKENLEGALEEAKKHAANIQRIGATRDELSAAFERIYQLVKRIHSQMLSVGLSQGGGSNVTASVDELSKTLEQYEREHEALAKAEEIADREISAALKSAPGRSQDIKN